MFILRILLFNILLFITLPSSVACNDYQLQVNKAIRAYDLAKLERLLPILNRNFCPSFYIRSVKRSMSDIAAAEKWLKRAKGMTWGTQVVRGDIAVHHQDWQNASIFYNQATR